MLQRAQAAEQRRGAFNASYCGRPVPDHTADLGSDRSPARICKMGLIIPHRGVKRIQEIIYAKLSYFFRRKTLY